MNKDDLLNTIGAILLVIIFTAIVAGSTIIILEILKVFGPMLVILLLIVIYLELRERNKNK